LDGPVLHGRGRSQETSGLCLTELCIGKETKGQWIPQPSEPVGQLLEAAGLEIAETPVLKPETPESKLTKPKIPNSKGKAATKRRLQTRLK